MPMFLIALCLFPAADSEPDSLPKGAPPQLMVISAKALMIRSFVTEYVPVTKVIAVEVMEGGKKVVKMVTVTEKVPVTREIEYAVKDVKATTAGGKKLDTDALTKALATPRVVLISSDGKAVDPAYLKLYKPDTLVLSLPRAGVPPAGSTDPAPRPLPADR